MADELHYSQSMRRAPLTFMAPEGFTLTQWHRAAAADTGTSHVRVGRPYIVSCEWCPDAFAADSFDEAMEMFRKHEKEMIHHD